MNPPTPHEVAAVGVGGLAGIGTFLSTIEPILADISYIAAIVLAGVTLYFKFKDRNK